MQGGAWTSRSGLLIVHALLLTSALHDDVSEEADQRRLLTSRAPYLDGVVRECKVLLNVGHVNQAWFWGTHGLEKARNACDKDVRCSGIVNYDRSITTRTTDVTKIAARSCRPSGPYYLCGATSVEAYTKDGVKHAAFAGSGLTCFSEQELFNQTAAFEANCATTPTEQACREWLTARAWDSMPKTPSGEVDKAALRTVFSAWGVDRWPKDGLDCNRAQLLANQAVTSFPKGDVVNQSSFTFTKIQDAMNGYYYFIKEQMKAYVKNEASDIRDEFADLGRVGKVAGHMFAGALRVVGAGAKGYMSFTSDGMIGAMIEDWSDFVGWYYSGGPVTGRCSGDLDGRDYTEYPAPKEG